MIVSVATAIVLVAALWLLVFGYMFGAAWTPTSKDRVRKMLSMADAKSGEVVYDLGSGDGRIIMTAAKEFHARSVGMEINPLWVLWTQLIVNILGLRDRVNVVWGDFFRKDLSEANIVTLFLKQDTNDRLRPKLERELKPGTRVVSYTYTLTGWNPLKVDRKLALYVYRMDDRNAASLPPVSWRLKKSGPSEDRSMPHSPATLRGLPMTLFRSLSLKAGLHHLFQLTISLRPFLSLDSGASSEYPRSIKATTRMFSGYVQRFLDDHQTMWCGR